MVSNYILQKMIGSDFPA